MGCKNLYDIHVKPYLESIKEWRKTEKIYEIASRLNVPVTTFYNYSREYPELRKALQKTEDIKPKEEKPIDTMTISEFARAVGVSDACISTRLKDSKNELNNYVVVGSCGRKYIHCAAIEHFHKQRRSGGETIACLYCGKETPLRHKGGGRINKYCSKECYDKDKGRTQTEYIASKCAYCGEEFQEARGRSTLYCSRKCSVLARTMETRQSNERIQKANDEITQLYKEYEEAYKKYMQLKKRVENVKNCKYCNSVFESQGKSNVYCSDECARKAESYFGDHRLERNGKPDRTISLVKVYERDKGICQLCGDKIYFDLDPNDNKYPSIDHIVPLAKGGLHSWDNVQLACRICNSLKRDRIDSPPRLKIIG